jgi:hypothetical protein
MIRLEAKKVMTNQKGLLKLYADIRSWIPKTRKKHATNVRKICRIHQNMPDMKSRKQVVYVD